MKAVLHFLCNRDQQLHCNIFDLDISILILSKKLLRKTINSINKHKELPFNLRLINLDWLHYQLILKGSLILTTFCLTI